MIRRLKQAESGEIEKILMKVSNFTDDDVKVGMELVGIAAKDSNQTDYNVFVYDENKKILGYHCIGKRPLTDAVYDLYWIVVDPDSQIKGIGKKLIEHAEDFVKKNKGRWLLVETSSSEKYSRTRNFYLRNNYSIVAQINDFYSVGNDLIVFGKFFK